MPQRDSAAYLAKLEIVAEQTTIMPRPLTRAQQLENAAFLAVLRRTGNVRAAVREIGRHRATFTKRRAKHAAFALEWDAALAVAHAALNASTGAEPSGDAPRIIRARSGKLQMRTLKPGRLDRTAEQAFLAALSATANIRLSAAAAGFSHSAFYARRRDHPGFAREMRLALAVGYERLETALMESCLPEAHADDAWRHNASPPIPPMTPDQAMNLLALHQKEVRFWDDRPDRKRKRGEIDDLYRARLAAKWYEERHREREDEMIDAAIATEGSRPSRHEPPAPALPALDQVKGWSSAEEEARAQAHRAVAKRRGWKLGE